MPPRGFPALLAAVGLGLVGLALLVALVPAGDAQPQQPGFGGVVEDLDQAEHVIDTDGPDSLRFRDADEDGNLDQGDPVYAAGGSTVAEGDARIANPTTGDAFTKVDDGDADVGRDTSSLDGTVRYFDKDRSGAFSAGDLLYVDLAGSNDGDASVGDVILAGPGAGTLVDSDHDQLGYSLRDLDTTPTFGFYDEGDDGDYDAEDAPVLDVDADGYLAVGDVRLAATDGGDGGTIADLRDADVTYRLEGFDDDWTFQHRDPETDETFSGSEAAYLTSGTKIARFAVRLANPPSGHEPGSQVVSEDGDWRVEVVEIDGELAYSDADDDGFDANDTLYYDVEATGEAERGDLVLSGGDAGHLVSGDRGDQGVDLTSYDGTVRYVDANGNGVYGGGDLVYADTDDDDTVTNDDVQLSDARDPFAEDAEPPSITVTAPADGESVTEGDELAIEGTATPGDADLDRVNVTVDGDEANATGLDDWSATWTAEGVGNHTVNATVTDVDGEANATTVNVTVEAKPPEPPTIGLDAPDDGASAFAGDEVAVEGTAAPGDANLSTVTVTAGGEELDVEGLEAFNATWTPEDPGTVRVEATVTDAEDLTASANATVTVEEPEPPTVAITAPGDGAEGTVGEPVNVTGTASAGSVELANLTVTAGDAPLEADGLEAFEANWTPAEAGLRQIEATVTDERGQEATDGVTVNVTEAAASDGGGQDGVPGAPAGAVLVAVGVVALAARRVDA